MKTWDDDRHVLTAYLTEDPDYSHEDSLVGWHGLLGRMGPRIRD
jgi:hypothetical protein